MLWKSHTTFSKEEPVSAGSSSGFWFLLVPSPRAPLSQETASSSWIGQADICEMTGGWFSEQHPHPVQMSPLLWRLPWPSSSHSLPAQESLEEWITSSVLLLLPAHFCLSFYPTGNRETLGCFHLVSPRHKPMRLVLLPSTIQSLWTLERRLSLQDYQNEIEQSLAGAHGHHFCWLAKDSMLVASKKFRGQGEGQRVLIPSTGHLWCSEEQKGHRLQTLLKFPGTPWFWCWVLFAGWRPAGSRTLAPLYGASWLRAFILGPTGSTDISPSGCPQRLVSRLGWGGGNFTLFPFGFLNLQFPQGQAFDKTLRNFLSSSSVSALCWGTDAAPAVL